MTTSLQHRDRILIVGLFTIGLALFLAACTSGNDSVAESDQSGSGTETGAADDTPAGSAIVPSEAGIEFDGDTCEFLVQPGFDAECGWVEVPQNWDDDADPDLIRLHVATITNDQTPDTTPVVYLEGGPGGDLLGGLEFSLADQWGQLIDEHPLIVFTQRGSALSEVDLECEEVIDAFVLSFEQTPDLEAETADSLVAIDECADRLVSEGADLTSYNTVASANDAEAVRLALGLDTWNVLGISYGTRLGQELLRQYPDGVSAIVLDSIQPVDPMFGSDVAVPTSFERALQYLFDGCATEPGCAEQYPNLDERLFAIVEQAAETPFEVEALDQLDLQSYDAIIDDTRLTGVLFNSLYSPTLLSAIPAMIEELEQGETTILATMVGLQITNGQFLSHGQFYAVMCHDYSPTLRSESDVEQGLTGDPFFDGEFDSAAALLEDSQELCQAFPSGVAPENLHEPVQSTVPALLLSGGYDPITPPLFASAIEPGLTNSQNIVHPNESHGVTASDCGLAIALEFLADPNAEVDTSCIDESTAPPFITPSLEGQQLEPFQVVEFGILGVRPVDWLDQGFGTFVRTDVAISSQLILLQQAAPIGEDQLVAAFAGQLEIEFEDAGGTTAGGRTWSVREGSSGLGTVRLWTRLEGTSTLAVALIGDPASIADAEANIIDEVLSSLRTLG